MTISPYSTFFWRGDNAQPLLVRRRFRSANGVKIRTIATDADGNDIMQQQIDRNYSQIKADVVRIIEDEMTRIKNDPDLKHLIPQEENDKDNE